MWQKTIEDIAVQLCSLLIKDYDVALLVAKCYVSLRVNDSINSSREYHNHRLWDGINFNIITIDRRTAMKICPLLDSQSWKPYPQPLRSRDSLIRHRTFNSILRYLQSERGFHQHYWNAWRSAASIPWRDQNEIISLKDKLNDLKKSRPHITSSYQFHSFDWLANNDTH